MSQAQFSTNEAVSLEKQIENTSELVRTPSEKINEVYEVGKCAKWIESNGYKTVCLQFPDHLLPDSHEVALQLQNILDQTVYVLADTTYESCCIDYIAAAHINADAIIHYGAVCFSQSTASIPFLYIFEKLPLDIPALEKLYIDRWDHLTMKINRVILLDTGYFYLEDEIRDTFSKHDDTIVKLINEEDLVLGDSVVLFIGDERKLLHISCLMNPRSLCYLSKDYTLIDYGRSNMVFKRRYFLAEKVRDSQTFGIIVGTLSAKNHLKVIDRMKKLLQLYGKKYYIISVGKPTVAKLANFPEIDIYILVACSLSSLYDSRDFYRPIAIPYDVEFALNPKMDHNNFSFDYNTYLQENDLNELNINQNDHDVSLLTGNIRKVKNEENSVTDEVASRNAGIVAVSASYGAGFLNSRSWKGLEQNLGQTEVQLAEEGRSGIAQSYDNENNHD